MWKVRQQAFPSDTFNTESRYFGDQLNSLRIKNTNGITIAQINVNSIKNKFDELVCDVKENLETLKISDTKVGLSRGGNF